MKRDEDERIFFQTSVVLTSECLKNHDPGFGTVKLLTRSWIRRALNELVFLPFLVTALDSPLVPLFFSSSGSFFSPLPNVFQRQGVVVFYLKSLNGTSFFHKSVPVCPCSIIGMRIKGITDPKAIFCWRTSLHLENLDRKSVV